MDLTLVIALLVFLVVFTKRKSEGPAFLPQARGESDIDPASMPVFKSTWKDGR
jgi:hypothetical protein